MEMLAKVKTDEAAPTKAKFPPVSNLHNTVPVTPSGCVKVWLRMYCGVINEAYMISATAKLTRR